MGTPVSKRRRIYKKIGESKNTNFTRVTAIEKHIYLENQQKLEHGITKLSTRPRMQMCINYTTIDTNKNANVQQ